MPASARSAPWRHHRPWTLAVPIVAALVAAPAVIPSAVQAAEPGSGLVVAYPLDETSGTVAHDASGNGRDASFVGGPTLGGADGVRLDGDDDYVHLPDDVMAGLSSVTVSTEVLVRPEQSGDYFIWGLGNTTDWFGDGYLFATGNPARAGIASGNWSTEQETRGSANLERGVWTTMTYTLDADTTTARLYLDGVQVAENSNTTTTPGELGGGTTTANYLGRSTYTPDKRLAGSLRDFRVYDRALSADEVAGLVETPDDRQAAQAALDALTVTNIDDVRGNLALPPSSQGLDVSWSSADTTVITADGVVTRPADDTTVALTASVTKGNVTLTRSLSASVRKAANIGALEGYTFAYFTGNSVEGENIYFAASNGNDALSWTELNGGQPTLTSTQGERGLRDPFLIRSPEGDTFYLIATDLSIGRNGDWGRAQTQGSKYLEVWESHDLITWSEQRHVRVAPDNAGNTWAPEAYYDETLGEYVVFWASSLFGEDDPNHTGSFYQTMMYATTRDFTTFSEPKVWQDFGASRIDSTVLEDDGTYYRFTKDEASTTGCRDIIQESSSSLTAVDDRNTPGWSAADPAWKLIDSCIGRDAGLGAVEGPTIFRANPGDTSGSNYYLFVDEYGGRGYIPLGTDDLDAPDWQVPASYRLPASPRHGTVMPVTAAELAALRANLPQPLTANEQGELLRYDFTDAAGAVLHDRSGAGRDAQVRGGAAFADGALTFDGTDDYVDLPDNVLVGVDDITVEAELRIDPAQRTPYFLYGFGNTGGDGAGNGYLFSTGDQYRAALTTGNWSGEQNVTSGAALPRDRWVHLTYTLSGSTARLYLDGQQVAENTNVTVRPGDIGGGSTLANYLGKSVYNADNLFRGQMREFALYNRALTAEEIVQNSGNTSALGAISLQDADALKVAPIVDTDARTVLFPVQRGTDLTQLRPVFTTASGTTATPPSGTARDLRTPATVTLTTPGEPDVVWTLEAIEMKSPVLPGLYADPNIAVFGDTYYIYATTDGTPGWGGNTFYVWTSKNLVDWTRSDEPILKLDGANGNVPWATGNAWAPTIIEKGGRYYFYFSGHEPTANRKMIGVAVADSPVGPFTAQAEPMITNDEAVNSGQAIDPAAFTDPETGKSYLFWGNGRPVYGELSDDMLSVKAETIKPIDGLVDFREGLFLNYRDGTYHLTYSIDDTGSENYRVGYATSTSIDGPWTYRGILLQKDPSQGILGTGHSSIINVPGTDEWYIAYHRFAIPGGNGTNRETTIDRVEIGADGLFQTVTPTLASVDPRDVPGATEPNPTEPNPTEPGTAAPVVSVSATTVERGRSVQVTVTGLEAREQVTAELRSDPIRVAGIPAADVNGRVAFDVRIPADLPTGGHTIVVFGADGQVIGSAAITVVTSGQLAVTGAEAPLGGALLAALLLVAGGVLWSIRPARRDRAA